MIDLVKKNRLQIIFTVFSKQTENVYSAVFIVRRSDLRYFNTTDDIVDKQSR